MRFEVIKDVLIQIDAVQSGTSVPTFHGILIETPRCSEKSVRFYQILWRHAVKNSLMQLRVTVQDMKEIGEVEIQAILLGCMYLYKHHVAQ